MKTFRVDAKNRVRAVARTRADQRDANTSFASETELKELAASWPSSRLLEVWNGLPGVTAVGRFTSRGAAVSRIWKAVQTLEPSKAERQAGSAGSRKDQLIAMLQTPGGATLPQLMQASGWQAHSVRGFLSGTLKKKMGLPVSSSKNSEGERVYRVPPSASE
jgi:Protein of unknown function (DUF3489)